MKNRCSIADDQRFVKPHKSKFAFFPSNEVLILRIIKFEKVLSLCLIDVIFIFLSMRHVDNPVLATVAEWVVMS